MYYLYFFLLFFLQCFATGTVGFVIAGVVIKMIATESLVIPAVDIQETAASLAYRIVEK